MMSYRNVNKHVTSDLPCTFPKISKSTELSLCSDMTTFMRQNKSTHRNMSVHLKCNSALSSAYFYLCYLKHDCQNNSTASSAEASCNVFQNESITSKHQFNCDFCILFFI